MRLETTFQGAGVLNGDLTPECAAVVGEVLDALSAPAGAEDDRTREQRYHDALAEAMRRLVAASLLPERAGQPVKVWAHISLADLLRLDGSSALQEQWTAQVRARWAAHRAAASETGANDGAWLDGDAAEAIACDAAMAPIVTGDVNVDALETSDAVKLSSCPVGLLGCGGECGGFVVVLAGGQAVVEAAEEAAEQVALGGGVPVAGIAAAVVVGAGAG